MVIDGRMYLNGTKMWTYGNNVEGLSRQVGLGTIFYNMIF